MVIEVRSTSEKCVKCIANEEANKLMKIDEKRRKQDELAVIRNNFLYPNEVTFCTDVDDSSLETLSNESKNRRKRYTASDEECDSIASTASVDKKKPNIPDGGFGWVVVFASLVTSLIADGVSFSFGLIYTELLIYFGESKSKTAMIGSLFLAIPLLAGPIMSNLVDNYGCRKMTIIGGLLAGLGFVLAAVSTSIEMMYVTFGVLSGLGLGIGYVTAVVSIAFWFDKRRTFATGIGASGTGIGTFLYAPFTQWLLDMYGWRGCTLVLAGTMFNICVCGCLMRDPDWVIEENRLERASSIATFSNSSVCLDEIKKMLDAGAAKETVLDTLVTNCNTEANQQIADCDIVHPKKCRSEMLLPTYLHADLTERPDTQMGSRRSLRNKDSDLSRSQLMSIVSPENERKINQTKHIASVETLNASEKASTFASDEGYMTFNLPSKYTSSHLSLDEMALARHENGEAANVRSNRGNSLDILFEHDVEHTFQLLPQEAQADIVKVDNRHTQKLCAKHSRNNSRKSGSVPNQLRTSHYLKSLRVHRNSIHYRGAMLNTHRYRLKTSSCPNIYRNSMTTIAREEKEKWYESFMDVMKSTFDFSLFMDSKFAFFEISTLLLFIWFVVPYLYITEHMLKFNYTEEDSAKFISVIGIFNTIGMIFLGWCGDRPWLNVCKTYAVCLVFCGISVVLMPLVVENYTLLLMTAVLFGITFASSFSFTPIILVRLVDLDDFTCAYGLVLLVQGVGNLIGPPLAGFIFEFTGRWDDAFYAAGFFIALSGCFVYVTGILEDRDAAKEAAKLSSNIS